MPARYARGGLYTKLWNANTEPKVQNSELFVHTLFLFVTVLRDCVLVLVSFRCQGRFLVV